jgi:hypothetical protein
MNVKRDRKHGGWLFLPGLMLSILFARQALCDEQPETPKKLFTSVVAANGYSSSRGVSNAMALGETAIATVQAAAIDDADDQIQIELLPGFTVLAQKTHAVTKRDGEIVWYGQIENTQHPHRNASSELPVDVLNSVTLVRRENRVAGTVQVNGDVYEIQSPAPGETIVTKVDTTNLPKDDGPDYRDAPAATQAETARSKRIRTSHSTIDVMFAFSREAEAIIGDRVAQQLFVDAGLANINQANVNSQVDITFESVGIMDVTDYPERDTFGDMLDDLTDVKHAQLGKPVDSFRSAHHADLVVMVVANRTLCGLAWRMPSPRPKYGLSVVAQNCFLSSFTVGHEMGHNFGASHNLGQYGGVPKNDPVWGHGIQHAAGPTPWRDIMAYECSPTKCPKILIWSNPTLTYQGDPVGSEEHENVARVLNDQRETMASFYTRPGITHPKAVATATPREADAGITVTLDGSGSSSPDGGTLRYEWVQTSGSPALTIERSSHAVASVMAPALAQPVTFDFTLIVTSAIGESDSQSVKVAVNASRTPEGPPIIATLHVPSSVVVGDTLQVGVDARSTIGRSLNYTWYRNSSYLSGTVGNKPSGSYVALDAGQGKTSDVYVQVSDGINNLTTPKQPVSIIARPADNGPTCHPAWSASTVYGAISGSNPAALVSYGGHNYEQQFWTQGQNPQSNNGAGKAWRDLGPCQ